ncbi:PAX-interacting protein 1 [Morone saxatilis]|uniref:PAX-interacting protein 1 n=1 Tax=Morone saxatilis TaxID=34816 RepID=UPI0015E24B8E|nr:PAX-interacting protein 1 [Morone saxatilis]
MSEEENKVSDELFKDVKFYVVGDIDQKVVQLLKAGKGKEVSYNALATHIIAEDGDNPEVGESREVFDLPVVKPSWVILSVRCGDLLPVTGFSPESGQIFFGVTACLPRLPDDLNGLWAYITFYGGECQLNLNKKVTHLVVKEPKGTKFECALKHPGIKIVTVDWITDSVKDKSRKDEALYHPRLTYVEPEEEEESEAESYDQHSHSDGSYSPRRYRMSSGGSSGDESSPRRRPGPKKLNSVSPTSPRKLERRSERMFDDSDDDSSTEKEGTNLNWTPAEVATPMPHIPTGTARRRGVPPSSKDPVSSTGSGLINLCATVPPVPGGGGAMPAEARSAAAAAISHTTQQGQYVIRVFLCHHLSSQIISVTGFVDADRDDLKLMAYLAGARYTGYLCRSNTVLICKEPSGLKYEKAKEWKIPCVNAQWLCDILLGNFEALRQIQHSRYSIYTQPEPLVPNPQLVQNLLAAWRTPIKVSPEGLASLQLLQKQKMTDSTNQPANKKARLEEIQSPSKKLPPESTPRVLFTGFEPTQVQQYTKRLHALGGEVADSSQKVTHLVASKVTRTVKFLTAMSVVKHIISPEWLEESWRSQKFVDEQSYTLRDAEAEVLFGFSLEESLKRAHSAPLFKGKYFYLTPGICPSLSTMKSILESAGGKLLAKQPSYRKIMEHKQNKNLPEIILISCDNDLHLCREYFLKNIDVHNAEFILTGVLTQKLNYDSYKFT